MSAPEHGGDTKQQVHHEPTEQEHGFQPTTSDAQHGVAKIEALTSTWTKASLYTAYTGLFLGSIMASQETMTTFAYQPAATSSFQLHTLLSTIGVVTSVLNATVKPPIAKVCDVFGRFEALTISMFLVVLGFLMKAASQNVETFAASNIFSAAGGTGIIVFTQIFIADTTSILNRALFSSLPDLPYLFTSWTGGPMAQAVGPQFNWRWGYGMWAIIYPVAYLPLLVSLFINQRRAGKKGLLPERAYAGQGLKEKTINICKDLDAFGLLLFSASLIMILVPFTLTGTKGTWPWNSARTICLIVFGVIVLFLFIGWENTKKFCERPLLSARVMKDPTVACACALGFFYFMVYYLPGAYFYTWLQVVRGYSTEATGNISNTFTFSSSTMSIIIALCIKYTGNYKWWMMSGIPVYALGYGLMIAFRTQDSTTAQIVIAQILTGVGGGTINVPAQVGLQAACAHQDVAIATAMFLTFTSIGGAVGNAITGAIWANLLPGYLETNLAGTSAAGNVTDIYGNYFNALAFPMGTLERDRINASYSQVYRIQLIVACCMAIPMIPLGLMMRNINLRDVDLANTKGKVIGNLDSNNVSEETIVRPTSDIVKT